MVPLICEDLARPDPVGDVIRSLGPNMVIALLADGPQLRTRWPARYASVLAEDPGSSVLSCTSLGMAKLSMPPEMTSCPSRVVACWTESGCSARELSLDEGREGLLLVTDHNMHQEFTADGRPDGNQACTVSLKRVIQV
jgi:hypothetical protein